MKKNSGIVYNKLIRDRIPEIIKEHGKIPLYRKIKGSELENAIADKTLEEAQELYSELRKNDPSNKSNVLKESADLLEVILAALDKYGFGMEELVKEQEKRNRDRGGFEEGFFLEKVK